MNCYAQGNSSMLLRTVLKIWLERIHTKILLPQTARRNSPYIWKWCRLSHLSPLAWVMAITLSFASLLHASSRKVVAPAIKSATTRLLRGLLWHQLFAQDTWKGIGSSRATWIQMNLRYIHVKGLCISWFSTWAVISHHCYLPYSNHMTNALVCAQTIPL